MTTTPPSRPLRKRVMHCLRRGHLYLGLLLLPWAVLYGATALLFNHPTWLADRPTQSFGPEVLSGTPLADPPTPAELAGQVVAAVQKRFQPPEPYRLTAGAAPRFNRDSAFATIKADGQLINLLIDVTGRGGTIRSRTEPSTEPAERAPFAIGPGRPRRGNPAPRPAPMPPDALAIERAWVDQVRESIPAVAARLGIPEGDVTVTSVPEVTFLLEGHGKTWSVSFNPLTGTVSATPSESPGRAEPMTARQFLLRLHLAHGYPAAGGARWFWAIVVDLMGMTLVFWGMTGVLMWWQIKATRLLGIVAIFISAVAAIALGAAMHLAFQS